MNVQRAKKIMEERGIDALVANSMENVFYVSEFVPFHLRYPVYPKGPLVFAILPLNGEPHLITPHVDIYVLQRSHPSWIKRQVFHLAYLSPSDQLEPYYVEGMQEGRIISSPVDAFLDVISEIGIKEGKIAMEEDYLPMFVLQEISKKVPNIRIVDSNAIFTELRSIKSEEEIQRMIKAYEAVGKGIEVAAETAREGVSEMEIANEIKTSIIREGADPLFILLGGGERGAYVMSWPTNYKLKKGDVIRLDLGSVYKGYASDAARNIVIGEPSKRVKRIAVANRRAMEKVIEAMRPGVSLGELFDIGINSWRENGFPDYRRGTYLGHGVGITSHEYPDIRPKSKIRLEPGMTISIEAPLYVVGLGGFSVEDTVAVTKDGYEYLGPYPRIDRELIIV